MRYLFGDSTESALEGNYLAFLRDAIDFCVALLQADAGLAQGRERRHARERNATEAISAVEEFGRASVKMADSVAKANGESPVGRAAMAVSNAAADAARRESAMVRTGLASDVEVIEGEAARLRSRCVQALGLLLAAHDLPDSEQSLTVRWNGNGYEARLTEETEWSLSATVELDIPSSSAFAHDLRVEKLGEGMEIHAPESKGLLKKEMKMVPHKLARHHITEVTVDGTGIGFSLRENASSFDVKVTKGGTVQVSRGEDRFATDDRDEPGLRLLAGRLEELARALTGHRKGVVAATLDEVPLSQHAHPRMVVERLVAAMTPVVVQIAKHSLTPTELVLKRLLAGDRREEIFVSKAELAAKLEPLTPPMRRIFVPLGIVAETADDRPPERPAKRTMPPPPPPPPRVSSEQSAAAVDNALRDLDET